MAAKITHEGTFDTEIKDINCLGREVFALLNCILWIVKITKKPKTRIYIGLLP